MHIKSTMKHIIVGILFVWTAAINAQQFYPVRDRLETTSLDGTWQLSFDGGEWCEVRVPGNWETQGVKTPQYGIQLTDHTGIYKRTFRYDDFWRGRTVVLRLDGVQNSFRAYINGKKVGEGHSAFNMHQFDITDCLHEGCNDITIEVNSLSPYWKFDVCDAWSFTGIQRSVEIFSVPREANIADVVFVSKVRQDDSVDVSIDVKVNRQSPSADGYLVYASLVDERSNHIADMQSRDGHLGCSLRNVHLWTAETPVPYRLDVTLYDNKGQKLQTVHEQVGLREVRVADGKILLNNKEIFLRGACLSEQDAIEGSAMSATTRYRQLMQMKQANINFIRTAHYPQDPVFTRLCDQLGFYVCEEIPFASRGDEYLKSDKGQSAETIAELKARAKATIDRDRNRPSVILWSHGNENKIYACQDSVLKFTKEYDSTRLRGVPQCKGDFISFISHPSEYVDVICGHYSNDGVLEQACKESRLPIINTEYAHSLGTATGELEHKYEIFRREPLIAGGSIWCYQDQSVLTHHFNQEGQPLKSVRIDSVRYIDNWGVNPVPKGTPEANKEGADGIVYGDGYPSEDYYEVAQVYTPVAIDSLHTTCDDGQWHISLENRYDFISLHGYRLQWQTMCHRQTLQSGETYLSAQAHATEIVTVPANDESTHIRLQVLRPDGSLCYTTSLPCDHTGYATLLSEGKGEKIDIKALTKALQVRVGRPMSIGLDYRRKGLYYPYLLPLDNDRFRVALSSKVQADGSVSIDYTITPTDSAKGKVFDIGLAITLPRDYTDIAWMGQGPFSHTPDKTAYNQYDAWQLSKDDIRFFGNRAAQILTAAAFDTPSSTPSQDKNKKAAHHSALTFISESNNLFLENIDGAIVISDNLRPCTYGTKFLGPQPVQASHLGILHGHITLKAGTIKAITDTFGALAPANAENPYLDSYGK